MLLTITTTHQPATDLGFLLSKHPDRVQEFSLPFGKAHVFYPDASQERCTAALLLDVDPVGLVRGRKDSEQAGPLGQYVNDRPYVASSLMSTAIARVFRSAMAGRSTAREEMARRPLPLEARLPAVSCRGGERVVRSLFEPLGYEVGCVRHPLDSERPGWGSSRVHSVALRARIPLADLLTHLYVLIPVLDDDKHYWVGDDEVDKLLRFGAEWLPGHPEHELITLRYLKHQQGLARHALDRLVADPGEDPAASDEEADRGEQTVEKPLGLDAQRRLRVREVLASRSIASVADLGCGEGKLLRELAGDKRLARIVGMDVSLRSLDVARRRLRLEHLSERQAARFELIHGSLAYCDSRLRGLDAVTLVEVVEHVDPCRLVALARAVFERARPRCAVVTTPNREYNVLFEGLPSGRLRHPDHRFEWTRGEFRAWASGVAGRFGYAVSLETIGPVDERVGPPTQMAVFDLGSEGEGA